MKTIKAYALAFALTINYLLLTNACFAQAPQGINYQGVARNQFGAAISMHAIGVQFKIHQGSAGGMVVFTEVPTPTIVTDTFGLYTHVIGSTNPSQFSAINWSAGNLFIEVGIDPLGGTAYQTISTTQLMSVPYALYAGSAGSSASGVSSVTVNAPILNTSTVAATPNLSLATVGTATTVGSSTSIPSFTVDTYGRITGVASNTVATSGGTVTSVTANAPLSVTNPNTTPTLSMSPANGSTDGFLSQTDWTTFNNKGNGTVTSISTGMGLLPAGTFTNTANISADNTNPIWNADHIQSTQVLTASLTSGQILQFNGTDWVNATLPAGLPSGINGQVMYDSAGIWKGSNTNNLFFNGTNMGIGTTTPAYPLDVESTGAVTLYALNTGTGEAGYFQISNGANTQPSLTSATNGTGQAGYFYINNVASVKPAVYITTNGTGQAVWANNTGTGQAGLFSISNATNTATALNATTNGTGIAGNFAISNNLNSNPALSAFTNGTGNALQASVVAGSSANSAIFTGGAGVQMDKVQIINGAISNYVLTSDAGGNATWQPASGGLPSGMHGQVMYDSAGTWKGSQITNLFFNGTNMGIGTAAPNDQLEITKNFRFPVTTGSTIGVIMQGADRFIHNYTPNVAQPNLFMGYQAGNFTTTVNGYNTGIGYQSMSALTTGHINTALGLWALQSVTSGQNNTAVGAVTLQANTTGSWNTGVGANTLNSNTTGLRNVAVGEAAYLGYQTGNNNTAIGSYAMDYSSEATGLPAPIAGGSNNTAIGYNAINANQSGSNNVAVGALTLSSNTTGNNNTCIGYNAQATNLTNATAIGYNAIVSANNSMVLGGTGVDAVNVGIGTTTPAAKLEVDGTSGSTLIIKDGNQAAGKVLTSNAVGNASWQAPSTGVSSVTVTAPITIAGTTAAPVIGLATSGVTTGNYGNSGNVPAITVDTYGRITNITTLPIMPPPVTGATNGLTLGGGVITLGGALAGVTTINQNTNNMIFNATTGNFQINNTGSAGAALSVSNGSTSTGQAGNFMLSSTTNTASALSVTTLGTGIAGNFVISNTVSAQSAIQATTNGTGGAGAFQVSNGTNAFPALNASTNGTGNAGYFGISNTANNNPVLFATTNGTGGAGNFQVTNATNTQPALNAATVGTSNAGYFGISNAANIQSALIATTNGTGTALQAINTGTASGNAGYFNITYTANGSPSLYATTVGTGNAGLFTINNATNFQPSLYAATNGAGAAVQGFNSGTGAGGNFQVTNNTSASNALFVATSGTGNSGNFSGGLGLKTDNITITNTAGTVGAVLTETNTTGGAAWQMPPAPVNFNAAAVSAQPFTAGVSTLVAFASTTYINGGGTYNGTTYTTPAAGIYHVDANVSFVNQISFTTTGSISIAVNGTIVRTTEFTSPTNSSGNFSVVINGDILVPTAGNTITIMLTTSVTGNNLGTSANTCWFNAHLVR